MSLLARGLYAYRFLEIVNRVCLIESVSCLSDSSINKKDSTSKITNSLRACDFEVFGTVQHVYFRQHTQQEATRLNLVGWVRNTDKNTVQGHLEGQRSNVDHMKHWLQTIGSPKSKITKAEFTNEKSITKLTAHTFDIKR